MAVLVDGNTAISSKTGSGRRAMRWNHIISQESLSRKPAVMQGMHAILRKPGILSLGPGAPSTDYFPFHSIDFTVPSCTVSGKSELDHSQHKLSAGRGDTKRGTSLYDLSIALQYGQGTGSPQMVDYVKEHVKLFHDPPYEDWRCILTTGNTSALDIALRILGERGDYLLVEEVVYSTTFETARPLGYRFAEVKMDHEGLLPQDLDLILTNWDEQQRGAKKPTLLYTIPTGQNPTGATQSARRRKDVYSVTQKHGVYILEDDPYHFIYLPEYQREQNRDFHKVEQPPTDPANLAKWLPPSYLSVDVDGRVLRMDSLSKVIAPGARMGWITASDEVVSHFIKAQEVSVQNPSGFAQIAAFKLLHDSWGHDGFAQWVTFLQSEYAQKRNVMLEACESYLPVDVTTVVPPRAGLFVWIELDCATHPDSGVKTPQEIEQEIFDAAVECGTLAVPSQWFRPNGGAHMQSIAFRVTFAAVPTDSIQEAIQRLGTAIRRSYKLDR